MDRLGLKFLVIALDQKTRHYVTDSLKVSNINLTGVIESRTHVDEGSHHFRSHQFNIISLRKMEAVYKILQLGYDVIFMDTDVILVSDPIRFLIFENVDYVHAINAFCPK